MTLESDPAAADVQLDTQTLTVTLQDERQISVPLSWYPRLLEATEGERNHWELLGDGYAITEMVTRSCGLTWTNTSASKDC